MICSVEDYCPNNYKPKTSDGYSEVFSVVSGSSWFGSSGTSGVCGSAGATGASGTSGVVGLLAGVSLLSKYSPLSSTWMMLQSIEDC